MRFPTRRAARFTPIFAAISLVTAVAWTTVCRRRLQAGARRLQAHCAANLADGGYCWGSNSPATLRLLPVQVVGAM